MSFSSQISKKKRTTVLYNPLRILVLQSVPLVVTSQQQQQQQQQQK